MCPPADAPASAQRLRVFLRLRWLLASWLRPVWSGSNNAATALCRPDSPALAFNHSKDT